MIFLKHNPKFIVDTDRPDILFYAIHYKILSIEEIIKYKPHILMFGKRHIETIILHDKNWVLFNKENTPDLFNKINKKLRKINTTDKLLISDLVFSDKGIYLNAPDFISEDLFYLCLSVTDLEYKDYLKYKGDLTQVVINSIPTYFQMYNNIRCLRYSIKNNTYIEISLKKIREIEGYDDFSTSFNYQNYQNKEEDDLDYSIYQYKP